MQASRVFVVTDDHTLIVDSRSRGYQRVGHINRAEDSSITEKPVLLIADSIIEIFPNNLPAIIDVVGTGKKHIGGKRHIDGFQWLFSCFFEIEAVLSGGRVGADDSSTIIDSKSYGAA
jgi:hypothetical protein